MDDTGFIREINDQPEALLAVTGYYADGAGRSALSQAADAIRGAKKVVFTGMGTSRHAAFSVRHELVAHVPACEIWDAGELFHFGAGTIRKGTVIIAISQSGESAETRAVVKAFAGKNPIIGIVNDPRSTIGTNADITLPIIGGDEASISNKTYTNTLAVLLMIADGVGGVSPDTAFRNLRESAGYMSASLQESAQQAGQAASFFEGMAAFHVIARGRDLTTAEQWSLILKEGAGVPGQGMSTGLFRHGPIELGGPDLAVAGIISGDTKPELTIPLAEELSSLGSRVLLVSDRKYDTKLRQIVIPAPSNRYFPLACAPFIELFVHEMAKQRGRIAGVFTHAVKITDRE